MLLCTLMLVSLARNRLFDQPKYAYVAQGKLGKIPLKVIVASYDPILRNDQ